MFASARTSKFARFAIASVGLGAALAFAFLGAPAEAAEFDAFSRGIC